MGLWIQLLEYALLCCLIGAGLFLTFRLGFVQLRRLGHSIAVTMGRYSHADDVGDVSHFQALSTALAATVGIGNIAGVAIAIHWAGPGAIFWMWVTAFFGAAIKFTEVTLALRYRTITENEGKRGVAAGGAMYYIERGLGPKWKPLAIFIATSLMITALVTGNALQTNTVADILHKEWQFPLWATGLITAFLVGRVVVGGIKDIVQVTKYLVPAMACVYVICGITILVLHADQVLPSFQSIFVEAFDPKAGVAGTGVGVFFQTLLWGVKRGLLSNEAGQASAPIAHSAAKTNEPVSEGTVALLEPFIDTLIICTITALVILTTGVWTEKIPTHIALKNTVDGTFQPIGSVQHESLPEVFSFSSGKLEDKSVQFIWHEVPVDELYVDAAMTRPFEGQVFPQQFVAQDPQGNSYSQLYGMAVESGAPLTMWAFTRALGSFGKWVVILCVFLFGISTAISWSYYGDRCVVYLWGEGRIKSYQTAYVAFNFLGAILALNTIWFVADIVIAIVAIPNVLVLVLLSGQVKQMAQDYFGRLKRIRK